MLTHAVKRKQLPQPQAAVASSSVMAGDPTGSPQSLGSARMRARSMCWGSTLDLGCPYGLGCHAMQEPCWPRRDPAATSLCCRGPSVRPSTVCGITNRVASCSSPSEAGGPRVTLTGKHRAHRAMLVALICPRGQDPAPVCVSQMLLWSVCTLGLSSVK